MYISIYIYLSIYLYIYIYIYIHFSSSFCLPPNHASLREQIFAEDQYTFCPKTNEIRNWTPSELFQKGRKPIFWGKFSPKKQPKN